MVFSRERSFPVRVQEERRKRGFPLEIPIVTAGPPAYDKGRKKGKKKGGKKKKGRKGEGGGGGHRLDQPYRAGQDPRQKRRKGTGKRGDAAHHGRLLPSEKKGRGKKGKKK